MAEQQESKSVIHAVTLDTTDCRVWADEFRARGDLATIERWFSGAITAGWLAANRQKRIDRFNDMLDTIARDESLLDDILAIDPTLKERLAKVLGL